MTETGHLESVNENAPQLTQINPKLEDIERKKALFKEIDLIQSIINRMANTSFLIKGWTVTMITLILASKTSQEAILLIFIPIFLFWFLDAYFLQHERLYRKLYQWVIENRLSNDSDIFNLNIARFKHEEKFLIRTMFSTTLGTFYGGALVLIIIHFLVFTFLV
jgi:hypothetical protein